MTQRSLLLSRSSALSTDALAATWFAACASGGSTVSAADKVKWNAFISGLRTDGLLATADIIAPFGAASSVQALIDIVGSRALSPVSAPTFAAYGGYTGNGSSSYVNLNFNPSTAGGHYALGSASVGVYIRTNRAPGGGGTQMGDVGCQDGSTYILPLYTDDNVYFGVNESSTLVSAASPGSSGFWVASRTSTTALAGYRNGSQIAAGPGGTATSITATALYAGISLRTSVFSTDQIALYWVGSGLDATQNANLYTRVQTLAAALGW